MSTIPTPTRSFDAGMVIVCYCFRTPVTTTYYYYYYYYYYYNYYYYYFLLLQIYAIPMMVLYRPWLWYTYTYYQYLL